MTFSMLKTEPHAMSVACNDDVLSVTLTDGRTIAVSTIWFPRLVKASAAQRQDYELLGLGEGIYWPQIDEDISVRGLLAGQPSYEVLQHA